MVAGFEGKRKIKVKIQRLKGKNNESDFILSDNTTVRQLTD
jgi:hypothetical protein